MAIKEKINLAYKRFRNKFGTKQSKPQDLSEEILSGVGDLGAEILKNAFRSIGAKPERLSINVLLQEGGKTEAYLIPNRQEPYISEERALGDIRHGETLYKLNIYRLR